MSFDLVDGIRIGRQVCRNPRFEYGGSTGDPSDWTIGSQVWRGSYRAGTIKLTVGSSTSTTAYSQELSAVPGDYLHDGKSHSLKFGMRVGTIVGSPTSGDYLLKLTCGATVSCSDCLTGEVGYQYLETPEIALTTSQEIVLELSKRAEFGVDTILVITDPRAILDEIELNASWKSRLSGQSIYRETKTAIGSPRQNLGDFDRFSLPVSLTSSSDASAINGWYAAGHPLTLRLGSGDGLAEDVYNVIATGRRSPFAKQDGIDPDYLLGTLTLESYR